MNRSLTAALLIALVASVASAGGRFEESRTLRDTVDIGGSTKPTIVVDNIFGSIRVTGHDRTTVEMVAQETIDARSRTALERAQNEVRLDVRHEGDEVVFYVDGPFRDRDGHCCRGDRDRGYTVAYDFELRVPRSSHLDLKTINEGEIRVDDVLGYFDVRNVNGGIELNGVGGSGEATTVNGPVKVRFVEDPTKDSRFKSVNGNLDFTFTPNLSADLEFKTFNGDVWTDFDVEPIVRDPRIERTDRDGKQVFRTSRWTGVRVARGGPVLSFETLNGDILIRNRDR